MSSPFPRFPLLTYKTKIALAELWLHRWADLRCTFVQSSSYNSQEGALSLLQQLRSRKCFSTVSSSVFLGTVRERDPLLSLWNYLFQGQIGVSLGRKKIIPIITILHSAHSHRPLPGAKLMVLSPDAEMHLLCISVFNFWHYQDSGTQDSDQALSRRIKLHREPCLCSSLSIWLILFCDPQKKYQCFDLPHKFILSK